MNKTKTSLTTEHNFPKNVNFNLEAGKGVVIVCECGLNSQMVANNSARKLIKWIISNIW